MRKVELVNGIQSSALGFGCAPILGAVNAKKAKFAIDAALEYGITHFDIARSYGYGEAERFVGRHLKSRRSDVVIATKFGIKANWKAKLIQPIKPFLRVAIDIIKSKHTDNKQVTQIPSSSYAHNLFERIPIQASEMLKSVEQSLKELNCDYIDYLFIHEPLQTILHEIEIFEMAEKLKTQGKIKAFGLAFMRYQIPLHKSYLDNFDILQFDNSPGAEGYKEMVNERGQKSNIIFSPLKGGSKELSVKEKLATLTKEFPQSVILCSMFNKEHLVNNVQLFE